MFKRKNTSDQDTVPEKRSRLSEEPSTSDTSINEDGDSPSKDEDSQTPSSPYKSFLGKFMPNLSWSKTPEKVSEKGDNSVADNSPSASKSPRKASSVITNCKGTVVLVGKIKLKNRWSNDLSDPTSEGYKTMSDNYIKEMNDLLHNSNVSKVFMSCIVSKFSNVPNSNIRSTRKSPGSVMVHSEMTFHHTYTKLFSDIQELCDNVEDFITLQSSLGEMDTSSITIDEEADSVNVEVKKEVSTEVIDEEENMFPNGNTVDDVEDDFVDAPDTHVAEDLESGEISNPRESLDLQSTSQKIDISIKTVDTNDSEIKDSRAAQDQNAATRKTDATIKTIDSNSDMNTDTVQLTSASTLDGETEVRGVSSTEGEIIDTEKAGSQEGSQIVVGKNKIPDTIGETSSLADKGGQNKNKKSEAKKTPPKQKSPNVKKGAKPSGSGLKSKDTHTPSKIKEDTDSDNDGVPSQPGVPVSVACTSNSITLQWNRPKKGSKNVDHYEIKYKECNKKKGKWISVLSEGAERTVKMKDLKAETEFEFKVRAVNEDGEEGPFCQPSVKLLTVSSLARSLIPMANLIEEGHPKVYKLPLKKDVDTVNERAKTRKCVFGSAQENMTAREKTIMVIGATGSGKTTLVDGMINYITDVSWEDDFRFSLVDLTEDEKKRKASEAESQTEWITCYTINKMDGSTIDYTLNIIDTPGFGDTRGIVRDKRIVDQIREFFTTPGRQGISCLDAVCFVTQAPLGKLTPPQRYIFDQILSVFGQDIKSNIFVLITFADANEPPVRAALKAADVPYQKSYKFNNSALYASNVNPAEAEMGNLFWKMGKESFKIFFDELRSVESKSLLLTSEVLQLRKRIEATIQGLQQQIADGINQLNTIKQEKEALKRHKADIKAKKDFTYEVDEVHMFQVDLEPGVYVTNCMTCNRTCHFPCGIPDDGHKQNCAAIDKGLCTVCPMNCHWTLHKNNNFRFDTYTMKVTKTYEELKKKYEVAQKEAEKHKNVLGKVKTAFTSLGQDVMKMVHEVRCYLNKLNDIALRPNPLSDKDYIDLLIESEKNEKKYGWEQRINLFYKLRDEAELMEQMHQQNYQPWIIDDSESDDDTDDESSQDNTDDDRSTAESSVCKEEPDMEIN